MNQSTHNDLNSNHHKENYAIDTSRSEHVNDINCGTPVDHIQIPIDANDIDRKGNIAPINPNFQECTCINYEENNRNNYLTAQIDAPDINVDPKIDIDEEPL